MMSGLRSKQKLLCLFVRLVIVVSLAGYSTYSVESVMHSDVASSVEPFTSQSYYGDHGTNIAAASEDAHDHGYSSQPTKSKASCCVDYCGVAALTCTGVALKHPRSDITVVMLDDKDLTGRLPQLHRPPNI